MRSRAVLSLALGLMTVCSSCGLIFQGRTEEITVESNPPGATVTLNNGDTQVTPFSITVPRNEDLQFHFSKPGYQSTDVADNSQVEAVYLMVDVIPLMIPWAIDAGLGAGYAHQQTAVIARLDPSHGSSAEAVSDGPAAASVDPRGAKH